MRELLQAIDRYVAGSLSRQRTCVDTPGFWLLLSPEIDMVYVNYAVPTGAAVDADAVRALVAAFQEHERTPRLEFRAEAHPYLAGTMSEAGFVVEHIQPVMACEPSSFTPQPTPGVEVERLGPDSDLRAFLEVANLAFGMEEPVDERKIARTRKGVSEGHWNLAMGRIGGVSAGTGYLGPFEGVAELAGIGTHPNFRRKGVASAVSTVLMDDFFRSGGSLVWLSAGDDGAQAVYERLGFRTVATQMNMVFVPTPRESDS